MNTGYLKADIYSHFKNGKDFIQYGKKGERVKIIADHATVLLVEGEKGDRFPVKKEFVIT